jgi:hypothetical protein
MTLMVYYWMPDSGNAKCSGALIDEVLSFSASTIHRQNVCTKSPRSYVSKYFLTIALESLSVA